MVDSVRHDCAPQDVADRHRPAEKRNRAIEILRCELADPGDRLAMDALVSGRQRLDVAGRSMFGGFASIANWPRSMP